VWILKKLTFEYVKKYFENHGCELLAVEYINANVSMPYICECGNKSEINFNNFQHGKRCKLCGIEKSGLARRTSFEEMRQHFINQGCTLLVEKHEYIDTSTPMPYICECGNESKIRFSNFKAGHRCRECGTKKMVKSQKHSLEYVKKYFEDRGCTLLATEYKNSGTSMPYICECGNESKIRFYNLQQGQRCKKCSNRRLSQLNKHSFECVKQYFEDHGCKLLATEYTGKDAPMPYICECGNESKISFGSFKVGHRCRNCGNNKIAKSLKHSFEYVKQYFADGGCKLLATEYIGNNTSMPYICKCGNKSEIRFSNFKQGKRCHKCKTSRNEKIIYEYLEQNQIIFKPQFRFKKSSIGNLRFDFATEKGLIEYQGEPHYIPVYFGGKHNTKYKNLYSYIKRDHRKLKYLKQRNIPILYIPFWDQERIPEILDSFFSGQTPSFSEPPKEVNQYKAIRQACRDKLEITESEVLCGLIYTA